MDRDTKDRDIKKLGSMIGLARKAGAITAGTEPVVETVRKKKALCVYMSSDASANTKKKLSDKTAFYNVPIKDLPLTMDELAHCVGFLGPTAVISLTSKNFLKMIGDCLEKTKNEE